MARFMQHQTCTNYVMDVRVDIFDDDIKSLTTKSSVDDIKMFFSKYATNAWFQMLIHNGDYNGKIAISSLFDLILKMEKGKEFRRSDEFTIVATLFKHYNSCGDEDFSCHLIEKSVLDSKEFGCYTYHLTNLRCECCWDFMKSGEFKSRLQESIALMSNHPLYGVRFCTDVLVFYLLTASYRDCGPTFFFFATEYVKMSELVCPVLPWRTVYLYIIIMILTTIRRKFPDVPPEYRGFVISLILIISRANHICSKTSEDLVWACGMLEYEADNSMLTVNQRHAFLEPSILHLLEFFCEKRHLILKDKFLGLVSVLSQELFFNDADFAIHLKELLAKFSINRSRIDLCLKAALQKPPTKELVFKCYWSLIIDRRFEAELLEDEYKLSESRGSEILKSLEDETQEKKATVERQRKQKKEKQKAHRAKMQEVKQVREEQRFVDKAKMVEEHASTRCRDATNAVERALTLASNEVLRDPHAARKRVTSAMGKHHQHCASDVKARARAFAASRHVRAPEVDAQELSATEEDIVPHAMANCPVSSEKIPRCGKKVHHACTTVDAVPALNATSAVPSPLRALLVNDDPFVCPITHEWMEDPVLLCEDGHTYERKALTDWLAHGKATSPLTNEPLKVQPPVLVANIALRNAIRIVNGRA